MSRSVADLIYLEIISLVVALAIEFGTFDALSTRHSGINYSVAHDLMSASVLQSTISFIFTGWKL